MGILDKECLWYCNHCDSVQDSRRTSSGLWKCQKCNSANESDEEFVVFSYLVCPCCSAYMDTNAYEHYQCSNCGCTGTYDYEVHILLKDKE